MADFIAKILSEKKLIGEELVKERLIVGWREWASLPEFNVPMIKVKIDTGARTSALHAFDMEVVKINGRDFVNFNLHPIQRNNKINRVCTALILDMRDVKSSNGVIEKRFVIRTTIGIGDRRWDIDVTLTNRDIMKHRMLLGREAMQQIFVDPSGEFYQGKVTNKAARECYSLE